MPRVILLLIILCQAAPSRAIIPLELVAEYDIYQDQHPLARSAGWDAQHFYNDSTVVIVWLGRDDSLFYDLGDGNGVHMLLLQPPTQLPEGYGFAYYINPFMFKLLLDAEIPSFGVTAKLESGGSLSLDKAYAINLQSGDVDVPLFDAGWTNYTQLPHESASGGRYEAWPALPSVTERFIVFRNVARYDWDEGQVWSETYSGELSIYSVPSFEEVTYRDSCTAYASFPGLEQTETVYAGGFWTGLEWPCDTMPDGYCWFRESLRTVVPTAADPAEVCHVVSSMESPDYSNCYPSPSIAAARDTIGNQYAIIDTACYNAITGSLVWSISSLLPAFAGLNYPTPNSQLIFSKNWGSNTFNVYEPSTGNLVGVTSAYEGVFRYALNIPGSLGEIVTRSTIIGLPVTPVRVYRLVVEPRIDVVISYLPLAELLRLTWNSVPDATSYHVCRSPVADSEFCDYDVISVSDTSLSLHVSTLLNSEFFRVKAIFN